MKKDVIYVDIEDDITSIIGKVKDAEAKIVALVPPKRIGALQSVVNIKLLQRAAETAGKRVVLITNDQALTSLAASVAMPIAKNLQTKPEVPQISALSVDDEEVINGEELPVGELASTAPEIVDDTEDTDEPVVPTAPSATRTAVPNAVAGSAAATAASKAPRKGGVKVPNFDIFRKKLLLAGGLAVLLIAFLVWALFFAPRATIAITAKTNAVNIDKILHLDPNAKLDADQSVMKPIIQQIKKTASVDFDATGKKDVGERAKGTLTLTNRTESDSIQVPAGSTFTTSGGLQFTSDVAVTVPGAEPPFSGGISSNPGVVTVVATAADIGEKYNVGAQTVISNDVGVSRAEFKAATSGGSKRQVTVVSDEDIVKAKEKLGTQNVDQIRDELRKKFKADAVVINESFKADAANPVSTPKVGEEASSRPKLTAETTYTLIGVARDDLKAVFNAFINTTLDNKPNQKIYESGDNGAQFSQFESLDGGLYSVKVQATAQVGPNIDEKQLTGQLAGKRSGEIQQLVENIEGVEKVEVKFSPFWVTKAPDADKIKITFTLKNDS